MNDSIVHFYNDTYNNRQGDSGDSLFLIMSGEVSVLVNHVQVATLSSGAFFGEMALLSKERRSATVVAATETVCLVLSKEDFDTVPNLAYTVVYPLNRLLFEAPGRFVGAHSSVGVQATAAECGRRRPHGETATRVHLLRTHSLFKRRHPLLLLLLQRSDEGLLLLRWVESDSKSGQ